MRHRHKGRILSRKKEPRMALVRSLMRSIVTKDAIVTTEARAKEVRPKLEKLVTKEIKGTLSGHRDVIAKIGPDAAMRLKKDIVPKIGARKGGYLRITKFGTRLKDGARMAKIAFVD
jgi:large subunit ribosomal protein L17